MDWISLFPSASLLLALLAYFLGTARDRLSSIRAKQIEAMTQLHEYILETAEMESFDGETQHLLVSIQGKPKTKPLSNQQVDYQNKLNAWRMKFYKECNRAKFWMNGKTVDLVQSYAFLMEICTNWAAYRQGDLLEYPLFRKYLTEIFGSEEVEDVLKQTAVHGKYLDIFRLSDMCLKIIRERIRLEISSPGRFRLKLLWERFRFQ